jgi:hypothetical protein
MSRSVPTIHVVDDPVTGGTPAAAKPAGVEPASAPAVPRDEPKGTLYAEVPGSLLKGLENAAAIAGTVGERGKVTRQKAVAVLLWDLDRASDPAGKLGALVDEYDRGA